MQHQQSIYLALWARKYIFNASYLISDHLNMITKNLIITKRTDDINLDDFVTPKKQCKRVEPKTIENNKFSLGSS